LTVLVLSANYSIKYATIFAELVNIPPVLISLTIVSIGSCLPELIFCIKALRHHHDELAIGDILGTVISDATIYVGIMAIINPFSFPIHLIYVTGFAMFFAGLISTIFLNTDKMMTKKEGIILLIFYVIYLVLQFIFNLSA
jgi:cation:H+ antiporter